MSSLIRSRVATGVAGVLVLVGAPVSPPLATSRQDDGQDEAHADADADASGDGDVVDTNVVSPDMDLEVDLSPPAGKELRLWRRWQRQ